MSQPQTTEALTPTQYVVPVQSLQDLPKLAKATTPPPTPQPPLKESPGSLYWALLVGVSGLVALGVWTAVDTFYGGVDKRALQAELQQAKQQAEALQLQNSELQQVHQQQAHTISTAAAALGCPSGGPAQ